MLKRNLQKKKSLRAFILKICFRYVIIYIHTRQHTLVYDKTNWIYPINVLIWQAFFIFYEIDSKLNKGKKWKFFEMYANMLMLPYRTKKKFYSIQICEVNISSCIVSWWKWTQLFKSLYSSTSFPANEWKIKNFKILNDENLTSFNANISLIKCTNFLNKHCYLKLQTFQYEHQMMILWSSYVLCLNWSQSMIEKFLAFY